MKNFNLAILTLVLGLMMTSTIGYAQWYSIGEYKSDIITPTNVTNPGGIDPNFQPGPSGNSLSTMGFDNSAGDWEFYGFDLGTTLIQSDDFVGQFIITTPVDGFRSGAGVSEVAFGFINQTTSIPFPTPVFTNILMVKFVSNNVADPDTNMVIEYYDDSNAGGPDNTSTGTANAIDENTTYVVTASYDGSATEFTVSIYDLEGNLVDSGSVDTGQGAGFSVDTIATFSGTNGGTSDQFLSPWLIHGFGGNNGTTMEKQVVTSNGDFVFKWSDNTDATKTPKGGVQDLKIQETLPPNEDIGYLEINASAAGVPIPMQFLTAAAFGSAADGGDRGKSYLHMGAILSGFFTSHTGSLISDWIYVEILTASNYTITGVYRCPSATGFGSISSGCSGFEYPTSRTQTTMNGVPVAKIPNQGGGSGPSPAGGSYNCTGNAAIDDPRCYEVTIGNATLQVFDTNCYDETNGKSTNVTLNAFSTMTTLCNATVYHGEGCQAFNGTIGGNSLIGKFFDSTKDNTTCTANSTKNCVLNVSCAAVSTCSADGMNQTVECRYTMYYNANNTTWTGWMNVTDVHGTMGYNSSTIPVENLNALNVTNATLNLGTLAPGANTTTHTNGTNIENGGNIKIDLNLNGTSVFTCPTVPNIGIGNLTYDLTSATGYGSGTALTISATAKTTFNLDSAVGSSGVPTATNKYLYWGMGMPMGTVGGQTCSATIRVAAIMDQ